MVMVFCSFEDINSLLNIIKRTNIFSTFLIRFSFNFPGITRLTPNVALTGTATQSSTYVNSDYAGSPFVARYAIDANFETTLTKSSGACAMVLNTAPVWWQVDLLKVYEINKIAITGRQVPAGKTRKYSISIFAFYFYAKLIVFNIILSFYFPYSNCWGHVH